MEMAWFQAWGVYSCCLLIHVALSYVPDLVGVLDTNENTEQDT